jgi:hypothetical protein
MGLTHREIVEKLDPSDGTVSKYINLPRRVGMPGAISGPWGRVLAFGPLPRRWTARTHPAARTAPLVVSRPWSVGSRRRLAWAWRSWFWWAIAVVQSAVRHGGLAEDSCC